eukprot:TRINITY_DN20812_c0_g1_i2.p2 TRINITY_DN20812_c0_g1~~TRINITY_DN20812_c0_g1_i2.p2  ORF type:complete len:115 (-),score=15.66 TRINITY_DN20812_c0_g1_i2:69-413(-)
MLVQQPQATPGVTAPTAVVNWSCGNRICWLVTVLLLLVLGIILIAIAIAVGGCDCTDCTNILSSSCTEAFSGCKSQKCGASNGCSGGSYYCKFDGQELSLFLSLIHISEPTRPY